MYSLFVKPYADKIFKKLGSRDKQELINIYKKITQIQESPNRNYNFLHSPLQSYQHVHVNKSFVLIFKIFHNKKQVEIYSYEHHDDVYLGKWVE